MNVILWPFYIQCGYKMKDCHQEGRPPAVGEKSHTKMQGGGVRGKGRGNEFIAWLHYIAANKVIYSTGTHPTNLTTLTQAMGGGMKIKKKKRFILKLQIP
jgi:hypothetical protein